MFPPEIAQLGVAAPGLPDGVVGWTSSSAVKAIGALPGKVAVSGIAVFDRVQWGFVPSDDGWQTIHLPNERATEFAIRSRKQACEWIERFPRAEVLFVIDFNDQAQAAEAVGPA